MQRINEARLILTDEDARKRYDAEYARQFQEPAADNSPYGEEPAASYRTTSKTARAKVVDDDLARWMENARRQSVELARQTIKDFAGMSKVAAKEGAKAFGVHMAGYVLSGLFFMLLFAMIKGCN